jgi:hypothetical protein
MHVDILQTYIDSDNIAIFYKKDTADTAEVTIYIDSYCNASNLNSTTASDHEFVKSVELENNEGYVHIEVSETNFTNFDDLYAISIVTDEEKPTVALALNKKHIYEIKLHNIEQFDDICHDHVLRNRLLVFNFRENLLDNAYELNEIMDAMIYYNDLMKMSDFHDIDTVVEPIGKTSSTRLKSNIKTNLTCYNGSCSLL